MRHPTTVIASAAMTLALADVERRQANRRAQAEAVSVARTLSAVDELSRRLAAARHEVQVLEDEVADLDGRLIALQKENAELRALLAH